MKILTKGAVTTDAYSSGSQSSPKRVIPSSGDGSYLGVPCMGALLGRVEWEGEKVSDPPSIDAGIS